jgi:hypothetical protein
MGNIMLRKTWFGRDAPQITIRGTKPVNVLEAPNTRVVVAQTALLA